jgi:hypothetical protein
MSCLLEWLTKYESAAVWIEGLALVGIFGFDIWVARRDHKMTVAQLKLAQKQIEASHNAERAWVMTELSWDAHTRLHMAETSNWVEGGEQTDALSVNVKLTCSNEGRSPAWIHGIYGHCQVMNTIKELTNLTSAEMQSYGLIGPIGPGKVVDRQLHMTCPGHMKGTQSLSIYVVIEYRDIFENERMTSLGYVVASDRSLYRQEGLPERNRNT